MSAWWEGLTKLNQGFYCVAAFFSVFLVWQLIDSDGMGVALAVTTAEFEVHTFTGFDFFTNGIGDLGKVRHGGEAGPLLESENPVFQEISFISGQYILETNPEKKKNRQGKTNHSPAQR